MQLKISICPQSIVKYLLIITAFFAVVTTAIQISKYGYGYEEEWMNVFNTDREMNLPTWYSAGMLAFCAILLRIIAAGKKIESDRYYPDWRLLSLIFTWLAIDEVLSIHEVFIVPEVAVALKLPWFLHSMWVIPGILFVCWFARRFWRFSQHLPYKSKQHFFVAAGLYVGGALILEMIGSHFAEFQGQRHLSYALIVVVEEALEMSGIILLIYGLLFYLRQWRQDLDLHISILGKNSQANDFKANSIHDR